MIDISLTVKEKNKWFYNALESIPKAEYLNIDIQPFVYGVGKARVNAVNKTRNKYICFIDPDDYILGNPFEKALNALESGYIAYYSNHYIMENEIIKRKWFDHVSKNKLEQDIQMHHVVVYRRDIIERALPYIINCEIWEKQLFNLLSLKYGEVYGDEECHYVWRKDGDASHKKGDTRNNPREWHMKVKEIRENLNITRDK